MSTETNESDALLAVKIIRMSSAVDSSGLRSALTELLAEHRQKEIAEWKRRAQMASDDSESFYKPQIDALKKALKASDAFLHLVWAPNEIAEQGGVMDRIAEAMQKDARLKEIEVLLFVGTSEQREQLR